MKPTNEQQTIIDKISEPNCKFLAIDAVAGSGKTTLLYKITKTLNPKNGLYLAYNKAIATEAKKKFGDKISCMTTHSLAFQNTVRNYNLSVGFFNYKSINEKIYYEHKVLIIDILNEFCLSKFHKFDDYRKNKEKQEMALNIPDKIFDLTKKYLSKMMSGKIDITHAGYLKYYHMLLHNKKIRHTPFDLIMLDEAGDLNEVTLEIFKLLPSDKKIMVGDKHQNIYTFNGTINGFKAMRDYGEILTLTQSFRCSKDIARKIEIFCQKYVEPEMSFKGIDQKDKKINTIAYLSRTNSSLIGKMIDLNKSNIKYNLTRPAKNIFDLLLIVLNLKPGGKVFTKEWKFLQEDADEWNRSPELTAEYGTIRKYIANKYKDDIAIGATLSILGNYTNNEIYAAYESAKMHEKEKGHPYTLCTVHSSKGLEWDKVLFLEDMNKSIQKIVENKEINDYDEKDIESMNLYYVGCSRAIKELKGASYLEKDDML